MATKAMKPVLVTFVMCREIFEKLETGEILLVGPGADLVVPHFPILVSRSMYLELTSCRGEYLPRLEVIDAEQRVLCQWETKDPFVQTDPLALTVVRFNDVFLDVPHPGRFDLVLKLNGEEFARRPLRILLPSRPRSQSG